MNTFGRMSTLTALDIGSSKVCCVIAHHGRNGLKIVGHGYNAALGIKNGIVSDINQATLSVCNAVETAEQMANEPIGRVIINISGEKTQSLMRAASIALHKNRPVSDADIEKLITKDTSKIDASGGELIHCLPTTYQLDGGESIKDPHNIYGENLSLDMLLGYYPSSLYKNIETVVKNAHLEIAEKTFSAYASALACLVDDEKELGATVIDIGGGTTSIVTFQKGFPVKFSTIPVGGINITNDIAWGLTTSFVHAEDLKIRHGCAFSISQDETEILNVYPVGEEDDNYIRQIHKADLINIINPRVEEIFELVARKLEDHGLKNVSSHRVVLTGGTAQLPGIREVAGYVLDKQVRIGVPRNIPNLPRPLCTPTFSCALGMLLFAIDYNEFKPQKIQNRPTVELSGMNKIFGWFKQNF